MEAGETTDAAGGAPEPAADLPMPMGAARERARMPRPRSSTPSLGAMGLYHTGTAKYAAPDILRTPMASTEAAGSERLSSWLATRDTASQRALSEARAPSAAHSWRAMDDSAKRARQRADYAEVASARALSSSSRPAFLSSSMSARAATDALSDAGSQDRIVRWREQNARAVHSGASASGADAASQRRGEAGRELRLAPAAATEPAPRSETPLRCALRAITMDERSSHVVYLGVAVALLVRCTVGLGGWSGRGTPPMHGDLEAQRHWMELTLHLPVREWYYYDLPYWGLDYPPLTAWVSWLCGKLAMAAPALHDGFALGTSRGIEDARVIAYLRWTVLAADLLVFLPAVAWCVGRRLHARSVRVRHIALFTAWMQPACILIDHGHFQYNGVMLGLAAASFALLHSSLPNVRLGHQSDAEAAAALQQLVLTTLSRHVSLQYVAAAVFFSLSLCFKQMALYYAPAVFAVMLGRCVGLARQHPGRGVALFASLGGATLASMGLVFLPWLTSGDALRQVVHRMFPLARGLFEDKVANIWCALSVLPVGARYKLPALLSAPALAKLSLVCVLLAILPGCLLLFYASIETVRREAIPDEAQADQVVADVRRRRAGSVASSMSHRIPPSIREGYTPSQAADTSAHESSRGSDRRSQTAESLLNGSSSWRHDGSRRARAAIVPSSTRRPSSTPSPAAELLPYTLASTSLAFFLLGFQTHEKSILLPLLPLALLMTAKGDRTGAGAAASDWEWAVLAHNVGWFSLLPLLLRDGQALAWGVLGVAWNAMIGYRPWEELRAARASRVARVAAATYVAMAGLLVGQALAPPFATAMPLLRRVLQRYPDVFPVLNVLLCTPVLVFIWLWTLKKQMELAFASGLWAPGRSRKGQTL